MFSPIRSLWIYAQLIVSFLKLTLISTFTKFRFFLNPFARTRINTERAIEIRYQISLSEKKCPYEVLGLSRDCSAEEIRSAYKRLALFRHPDKLVRAGVPESEATSIFQELVRAHEILSDTQKREAYDSERNKIVYSTATANSKSGFSGFVPDLSSFFSDSLYKGFSDKGRGFYKVYGDLFEKIYIHELKKVRYPLPEEPPIMGNLESPDVQVTAFYDYWLGFVTSLDFAWADEHDVTAGTNKKTRRVKEDENMKLRKRAMRDYNETVRGLAKFVMKMDKRVIEMEQKKNEEMEKKREEERAWREEMDRQKAERVRNYVEPEWAKVEEVEDDIYDDNETENLVEKKELYCVACKKKFKSDEQWKNHEKSKKHKEKVAGSRN